MTGRIELTTDRLRLEPIGPEHAEELWRATEASLPELRPWMFWAAGSDQDSTRAFAEEAEREWAEGIAYHFAIRDREGLVGALVI